MRHPRTPHYTQQDKTRYLRICSELRELAKADFDDQTVKLAFIAKSLEAHALRGSVPKSWYRMVNV